MGRRITILMGLLCILAATRAQGQVPKPSAPPAAGAEDGGLPPISPAEPAGAPIESKPGAEPAALPKPEELPPPESLPGAAPAEGAAEPAARPKAGKAPAQAKAAPATRDDEVVQTQNPGDAPAATAPIAAPAQAVPAPADGGSDSAGVVERLPLGKQEVVLSVDVQAPQVMNFNREATVKIIVKNSGSSDALGVIVRDELPPGLAFVSSQPEAQKVGDSLLSWRISTLPAASDRVILLKVKPTKAGGALDHGATVTFTAGSKATSRVLRPRLKLEVVQVPAEGKVLKNRTAEFRIAVTNIGDGPARNVLVQAKLSPGLRHDTGEHNEDNSFELPLSELAAGQREDLDPLTLDAIQGGEQWCKISATSNDVDFDKESAEVIRTLHVVEPKLKMTLSAPESCITDAVAKYSIVLENTGDAPAKNVKVLATLGVSGRLVGIPSGAKYDSSSRRLLWTIPQIDPGEKPRSHEFEIRMGGINSGYEVNVEARGDNGLSLKERKLTDVKGIADVELLVRERRRLVDLDGTTSFSIRLRNHGTKEATQIKVRAELSKNLAVEATGGGPSEQALASPGLDKVNFPTIPRLGPGKEMELFVKVKVTKADRGLGTCRVFVEHDDLAEPLEDLAGVKINESRRSVSTTR
ncbi:MAG: hypothetical protein U0790_17995 [Isosphaeraceae bacterium]